MTTRIFLSSVVFYILIARQVYAQEIISYQFTCSSTDSVLQDTYTHDPATSLFVELAGKFWYTVNVDRRWSAHQAMSVGAGYFYERNYDDEGHNQSVWMTDIMYYHFFGARKRLETGAGVGVTSTTSAGIAAATIHGVLGYRLQRRNGLLFRAGFTPMMSIAIDPEARSMFIPFVGLSFGYSF